MFPLYVIIFAVLVVALVGLGWRLHGSGGHCRRHDNEPLPCSVCQDVRMYRPSMEGR